MFGCISVVQFVFIFICIAACYTLKVTCNCREKIETELTIPFLSILKLQDKLIKGQTDLGKYSYINTLTMQTTPLFYFCKGF